MNLIRIIHKMHKICCNMTQNTRNQQQVAKLSVKYYIDQLFNS